MCLMWHPSSNISFVTWSWEAEWGMQLHVELDASGDVCHILRMKIQKVAGKVLNEEECDMSGWISTHVQHAQNSTWMLEWMYEKNCKTCVCVKTGEPMSQVFGWTSACDCKGLWVRVPYVKACANGGDMGQALPKWSETDGVLSTIQGGWGSNKREWGCHMWKCTWVIVTWHKCHPSKVTGWYHVDNRWWITFRCWWNKRPGGGQMRGVDC